MISTDLGVVTAYGYAKDHGWQGTETEFGEYLANVATNAQIAEEAKDEILSSIDDTLSEADKAADSATVGAFGGITNITWTDGEARAMSSPFTPEQNSSWRSAIVRCKEGQRFIISGSGGVTSQLWTFFDEAGNPLITSGSNIRTASYITAIAPFGSAWLVVNSRITEESLYPARCIMISSLRKYTQEGLDVSSFTTSAGTTDWFWFNNQEFGSGYVDKFVIYGTDYSIGRKAYVAVYDLASGKFVWKSDGVTATQKRIEIPCNVYFTNNFYVGISLPGLAHTSVGNNVRYAQMWEFASWEEGAVFSIDWKSTDVQFKFAVECWYNDFVDISKLHYARAKSRLFVAGDSITAGYPYTYGISRPNYYDPDIRWGAQVGRKLGFDVAYGAQSGSGWLYRTASDAPYAISIADDTDFANYDVAVFAFGTNDYGNNIPLGNTTDLYPTNNTVCGAINYVINKVYTDNSKIVFIISSPINRSDRGTSSANYGYGTANGQGYTLLQLVEKMEELCNANGICFIDNSDSPFNKFTMPSLLVDNLHPNPDGYKILGAYMAERISHYVTPYTRNVLTDKY